MFLMIKILPFQKSEKLGAHLHAKWVDSYVSSKMHGTQTNKKIHKKLVIESGGG